MTNQFAIAQLFVTHIGLLAVNIYAFFAFINHFIFDKTPRADFYMVAFSKKIVLLLCLFMGQTASEIYFLINFFTDVKLYFYEYFAILDQIILTVILVHYIKKEVENGKR